MAVFLTAVLLHYAHGQKTVSPSLELLGPREFVQTLPTVKFIL